jgi:tyrosyl-tRNA synthetase
MKIKFGVDPTTKELHLGHLVPLIRLRRWQDEGHTVILVIGDFTATIGDPTGRDKTRPCLTFSQAEENGSEFVAQACRILDKSKLIVRFNSEWFNEMPLSMFMLTMKQFTTAQMLEREEFRKRMQSEVPISLIELTYPLMQGWDSVELVPDIELGGTDQMFNMNVGRDLMRMNHMKPQEVVTVPILTGTDGVKKMSKSLDNHIGICEDPHTIFTKIIGIPDSLINEWAELLLGERINYSDPRVAKVALAKGIVTLLFSSKEAEKAASHDSMPVFRVEEPILAYKLVSDKMGISNSQARQLLRSGAVTLNDGKLSEKTEIAKMATGVLRVGKGFFLRLQ